MSTRKVKTKFRVGQVVMVIFHSWKIPKIYTKELPYTCKIRGVKCSIRKLTKSGAWIVRLRHWAVAVLVLAMAGCGDSKPAISGTHWHGGELFNRDGINIASVIEFPFQVESAQGCIFEEAGLGGPGECEYFETGQLAYNWVGKEFARHDIKVEDDFSGSSIYQNSTGAGSVNVVGDGNVVVRKCPKGQMATLDGKCGGSDAR